MKLIDHQSDIQASEALVEFRSTLGGPRTPGIAVAILKNGKLISETCMGMASLQYAVPITPSTRFHGASLAKHFTAFAILLLAERGELQLDDDLSRFLPSFADFNIQLLNLLQHTSGLRDQWVLMDWCGWRATDTITTGDVLRKLSRQQALNFSPGTAFMYSNSGYTLLAEVVRVVSGSNFRAFMKEVIFGPLNMRATDFYDIEGEIIEGRAQAFRPFHDSHEIDYREYSPRLYVPGSTSILTTLDDMKRWDRNFVSPSLGSESISELMRSHPVSARKEPSNRGIGLFSQFYRGHRISYHSGNDLGFWAHYVQYLDLGFSVIAFNNSDYGNLPQLCSRLIEDVCLREGGDTTTPKRNAAEPPSRDQHDGRDMKLSKASLSRLCGFYESDIGEIRVIHQNSDSLMMLFGDDRPLSYGADDTFQSVGTEELCRFREVEGSVDALTVTTPSSSTTFRRIAALDEVDSIEYLGGTFSSPELETSVQVDITGKLSGKIAFPKGIEKSIMFASPNVLAAEDTWVRPIFDRGECVGLLLSGPRALNVHFIKLRLAR